MNSGQVVLEHGVPGFHIVGRYVNIRDHLCRGGVRRCCFSLVLPVIYPFHLLASVCLSALVSLERGRLQVIDSCLLGASNPCAVRSN